MKIVLISCYELGHQPFNLASPLAHLRAAGFEATCLDLAVQRLDEQLIQDADFVAFSTPMHTALKIAMKAAGRVRELNPNCRICFYGLYAGLHARYLLESNDHIPVTDFVIGGEFETPLVELVSALASGMTSPKVTGVQSLDYGGSSSFARQRFLLPLRKSLPALGHYARLEIDGEKRLTGYVEASRGCAHKCLHCPITPEYHGRVRIVQEEVVLADIEQLVQMGAQHITFGDPDFLNGVRHSMSIVRKMHEAFPYLTFDFTVKIEHILEYRHLFPELGELGCVFVVSAVELLNDTILRYLDKGHTRADVDQALQITREAGVTLRASLMPFTPWTQLSDLIELFDFVEEHGLFDQIDPIQYTIRLLIPPGSSILNLPEIKPHLVGFNSENMIYEWRHPDPEMDALQLRLAGLVEKATCRKQHRFDTYLEIRNEVFRRAGRRSGEQPTARFEWDKPAPRLTEDWFC